MEGIKGKEYTIDLSGSIIRYMDFYGNTDKYNRGQCLYNRGQGFISLIPTEDQIKRLKTCGANIYEREGFEPHVKVNINKKRPPRIVIKTDRDDILNEHIFHMIDCNAARITDVSNIVANIYVLNVKNVPVVKLYLKHLEMTVEMLDDDLINKYEKQRGGKCVMSHHRRKIIFDDLETLNTFKESIDFLFSNGGKHTNRMYDNITELNNRSDNHTYYILTFICDKGTWNYINALYKFNKKRITRLEKYSKLVKSNVFTHYICKVDDSKEVTDLTISDAYNSMTDEQRDAIDRFLGCMIEHKKAAKRYKEVYETMNEDQKKVCCYLISQTKKKEDVR